MGNPLTPLFIDTIDTVKTRLRLSGVTENTNAQAIVEEAVRSARVGFYRRLSPERITEIRNSAIVTNPETGDTVLRQVAEVTELKMIRSELLRTMPTLFADATATTQTAWNEEGMMRGSKPDEREMEIRRLRDEIEQSMTVLSAKEIMPDETSANTGVYVSETPPAKPFGSVFGYPFSGSSCL